MKNDINNLNQQMNVIWFVLIFILLGAYSWLRVLSKKVKDITEQLEGLKKASVLNSVNSDLKKGRKK
jgi:uncharacterized membrane protein